MATLSPWGMQQQKWGLSPGSPDPRFGSPGDIEGGRTNLSGGSNFTGGFNPQGGWGSNSSMMQLPGLPGTPNGVYQPGFDPINNSLYTGMKSNFDAMGALKLNTSGLDAYSKEALRGAGAPSAWANMANTQQNALASQNTSAAANQNAGATAGAWNSLARSGGVDSGARERLARGGAIAGGNAAQGINTNAANNKMQIGMNDEQNRISQLGALPGMQTQAFNTQFGQQQTLASMIGQSKQSDIQNLINEMGNRNTWNLGAYNINQGKAASDAQAAAYRDAANH